MYVRINGEMRYLWRAVDHEGEVLESFVTKDRDKTAALRFIKKALKRHGRPKAISSPMDCAPSLSPNRHRCSRSPGGGTLAQQPG